MERILLGGRVSVPFPGAGMQEKQEEKTQSLQTLWLFPSSHNLEILWYTTQAAGINSLDYFSEETKLSYV